VHQDQELSLSRKIMPGAARPVRTGHLELAKEQTLLLPLMLDLVNIVPKITTTKEEPSNLEVETN
jgi:hypothetical protein